MMFETPWHVLTLRETEEILGSNLRTGLLEAEAERRLASVGANILPEGRKETLIEIFIRQFRSPLIYILFAASVIVFALEEYTDGFVILFILFFNAVVGMIQEGKAKRTLEALKKFTKTNATVVRDGEEQSIPDEKVVPGDIILLEEGEKVPADARIVEARTLRVDESALTGESIPVLKEETVLKDASLPISDQRNMVFRGTYIVGGVGRAIVVGTGLKTAVGTISKKISGIDTEIPLEQKIRYLSRLVILSVGMITTALFFFGTLRGISMAEMFTTMVSLAVSIVPEGLPIVMTLVLATGVWRMAKRKALVKRLQAVEALGQAGVIAVDKTGTITKNEMVVRMVVAGNYVFKVEGVGYDARGNFHLLSQNLDDFLNVRRKNRKINPMDYEELIYAGKVAGFSSNVMIIFSEKEGRWVPYGDPTDAALKVFAKKTGFEKNDVLNPLIEEEPFSYSKKYHLTSHRIGKKQFVAIVGAPEVILNRAKRIMKGGRYVSLTQKMRTALAMVFENMSQEGLRVVAYAYRELALKQPFLFEKDKKLIFGGFFGIEDSLRPEVPHAMNEARRAGIKVVMITGDHKTTAIAIAKEAGIYKEGDLSLTGDELRALDDKALDSLIRNVTVFARVVPEDKLRIIQSYRRQGEVVAMTGDGVNDALSLVAADLGVAMGKIGTEVAKEASDIVLLDDNFGSIISAIEEGRSIYKTIRKVILYLFSTSLGEVLTIAGAIFLGYPIPLLASQIIWLNFITDGFLTVALAMEPKERRLIRSQFEKPKPYIIDRKMLSQMPGMAIIMAVGTIMVFREYLPDGAFSTGDANVDLARGSSVALTALAAFQWINAWNCRSEEKSVFRINFFSNKFLVGATVIVVVLQLIALHSSFFQNVLHTVPLTFGEWVLIVIVSLSILVVEEIRKAFYRRNLRKTEVKKRDDPNH